MPNILGDDTWPLGFIPPPGVSDNLYNRTYIGLSFPFSIISIFLQYDFRPFLSKHPLERSMKPINALIEALKEQGVTRFAATGYCFGAKNVIEMAIAGQIVAGALNHPSRLNKPKDFERLLESGSTTKILINGCEIDEQFPLVAQKEADELLEGGKYKGGYKRVYWEGCKHGFAVTGDSVSDPIRAMNGNQSCFRQSNPQVKAGMEGAFKEIVELFKSTL